jgi:peptidoglycan/LPS O-acetylase OafA/YrhL
VVRGGSVGDAGVGAGRTIPYEPGLDGIRAISIAGVLLFHACATSGLDGWFRGGNLGVSVFFTLSGFLITTLLLSEHDRTGRVSLQRFWSRRIRRLVPASLTVVAGVTLLSSTEWFDLRRGDAWAAIWSVTNWHVIAAGEDQLLRTIVGPLGPTWSLAVEEQFYVGLAFGLWFASRRRNPSRAVATGSVVVALVSVVLANVVSDWSPRLEFGTDIRAAELAVGCLLAVAIRHRRLAPSDAGTVTSRRGLAGAADAAGAVALIATAVLFLLAGTAPWLLRGGHAALALIWAVLVVAVLAHGRVDRLLSHAPLVALGRWSYSLYLVHWPVFLVLTPERTGADGVVLVAVKLAAATGMGVALHHLVERPLRAGSAAAKNPAAHRRLPGGVPPAVLAWLAASLTVTALAALLLPG